VRPCGDRRSGMLVLRISENAALEITIVLYNISSYHYNSIIGMSRLIPLLSRRLSSSSRSSVHGIFVCMHTVYIILFYSLGGFLLWQLLFKCNCTQCLIGYYWFHCKWYYCFISNWRFNSYQFINVNVQLNNFIVSLFDALSQSQPCEVPVKTWFIAMTGSTKFAFINWADIKSKLVTVRKFRTDVSSV